MTYENYQETNPYKYKLSNGEIITNVEYESLLRSFSSTYKAIANPDSENAYGTEAEKEKITKLYRNAEFEANIEGDSKYEAAMEFDKYSRLVAYTHWNPEKQVMENNRSNVFEAWFEDITEEQKAEIRKQNNKKVEQQILKENEQEENLEYETIIHSKDFIEKFGDWEKAQRLEVLKKDKVIEKKSTVIVNDIDITKKIEIARKNNDSKTLRQYADMIAIDAKGTYPLKDLNNIPIMVSGKTIKESKIHITDPYQVEALTFIPDILNNGRFISHEKNEDVITHPEIKSYDYVICGLKINNEDFTAKSVIANDNNGNRYYDHQLSKIEKGKLLDVLNPLTSRDSLSNLPNIKDKRLLRVCQVSQRPYLDENLKPTQEAVKLVQEGKLYMEKDPVTGFTSMCNENECDRKILQFRNMFNAQQEAHEPKITYENAETILTNTAYSLDNISVSKDLTGFVEFTSSGDGEDIVEDLTPKEVLNRCTIFFNTEDLTQSNFNKKDLNYALNLMDEDALKVFSENEKRIITKTFNEIDKKRNYFDEEWESIVNDLSEKIKHTCAKIPNIKKLKEQNLHAAECTQIIENWIDACDVLGESKDFNNVMNHARDSFRQNIENSKKALSILDENSPTKKSAENLVTFYKEQFEYFKHNAQPLFDKAEENVREREEINKQKELSQNAELHNQLNENLKEENKKLKEENQRQNKLLYGDITLEVNGKNRHFPNGILPGVAKCCTKLDEANEKIERLNSKIISKENTNNISPKSQSDDSETSWN